ncbi:hypothetical protein RCL1_002784 [Eukaryota sp. TZLM3-RCL]
MEYPPQNGVSYGNPLYPNPSIADPAMSSVSPPHLQQTPNTFNVVPVPNVEYSTPKKAPICMIVLAICLLLVAAVVGIMIFSSLSGHRGTISGYVYVASTPVANVNIVLMAHSGHTDSTRTDASGAFSFQGWRYGDYTISVEDNEVEFRSEWVELKSPHQIIEFTTTYRRATFSGTVINDETSAKLSGVSISFQCTSSSPGSVTSNVNGEFAITNIPRGTCSFVLTRTGFQTLSTSVSIDAVAVSRTFRMVPPSDSPSTFSGTVINDQTSAKLSGVSISFQCTSSSPGSVTSNVNGEFAITNIPRGTCSFVLTRTGFQTLSTSVSIDAVSVSRTFRMVPVSTPPPPSGDPSLVLTVVDDLSNAKLSGVSVLVQGTGLMQTSTTNANGQINVISVVNGRSYTITATKSPYPQHTGTVTVNGPTEATIRMSMGPPNLWIHVVRDSNGNNIDGATVTATRGGTTIITTTNSQGRAEISPVSAGQIWSITVSRANYATETETVTVLNAPTQKTIQLSCTAFWSILYCH